MRSEYDSFACDPAMEVETPCDKCEEVPEGFDCQEEGDNFEDCPRWKEAEMKAREEGPCHNCKGNTRREECGDCPLRYRYDWEM